MRVPWGINTKDKNMWRQWSDWAGFQLILLGDSELQVESVTGSFFLISARGAEEGRES